MRKIIPLIVSIILFFVLIPTFTAAAPIPIATRTPTPKAVCPDGTAVGKCCSSGNICRLTSTGVYRCSGSVCTPPTRTPTPRKTKTPTPRSTKTPTPRASRTPTPRASRTPTPRATRTPTPRFTSTRTPTPRFTVTRTPTPRFTLTRTPTPRFTATRTPSPRFTPTRTPTPRSVCPDGTVVGSCCGSGNICRLSSTGDYRCSGSVCTAPTRTPTPRKTNTPTPPRITRTPTPRRTNTPTPIIAICNQACNPSINPPIYCQNNMICYSPSSLPGSSGLCRNQSCIEDTSCSCGVTATHTPTPTPEVTLVANLKFSLNLPDVPTNTSNIPADEVKIEAKDGQTPVDEKNIELIRNGNYFQTVSEVSLNIPQYKEYMLFVKTKKSIARQFTGIALTQSQTLDCTVASDPACGELILARDTKLILLGDSDEFQTSSGSYNKIDAADLQVLASQFNTQAPSSGPSADFNFDGNVDVSDLEILGKNYGQRGD